MPQFDPANFVPQLAWLAVIFTILYFGVVRLTLPKVGSTIAQREASVEGDVSAAAKAKAEADAIAQGYARDIAAARAAAQRDVAASHDAVSAEVAARLAELDRELDAKTAAAEADIGARRTAALAEIEALAKPMGDAIVERLLGKTSAGAA